MVIARVAIIRQATILGTVKFVSIHLTVLEWREGIVSIS